MKYIVNFYSRLSIQDKVNAQGKARKDVTRTLNKVGYKEIAIVRTNYANPFNKRKNIPFISGLIEYIRIRAELPFIKKGDIVLFQDYRGRHVEWMLQGLKKKGVIIQILVHDVLSLRFQELPIDNDVQILNLADQLYVHTPNMKHFLLEHGVKAPMKEIFLFDYYSDDPMPAVDDIIKRKNEIIYAGNLDKSEFISSFIKTTIDKSIRIKFYGLKSQQKFENNSQMDYICAFKPEKTGSITGGWGLVWDGNSINTCSGPLGKYLHYNSSHKMSLYTTCGIPLIVWDNSSVSQWVKEMKIGICISSLQNLATATKNISEKEYKQMVLNSRAIGERLREGGFLLQAMNINKIQ